MLPLDRAQEPTGTTESFIVYTDKPTYEIGETINICVKAVSIDPGSGTGSCKVNEVVQEGNVWWT